MRLRVRLTHTTGVFDKLPPPHGATSLRSRLQRSEWGLSYASVSLKMKAIQFSFNAHVYIRQWLECKRGLAHCKWTDITHIYCPTIHSPYPPTLWYVNVIESKKGGFKMGGLDVFTPFVDWPRVKYRLGYVLIGFGRWSTHFIGSAVPFRIH